MSTYTPRSNRSQHRSYPRSQQQAAPPPKETVPPKTFEEVADFCKQMSLPAEAVGRWIWVSFSQKPNSEIIKALRDFGFHWSRRRQAWAHNCGHPSQPGSGNPWDKYEHYWLDTDDTYGRQRTYSRSSDGRYSR